MAAGKLPAPGSPLSIRAVHPCEAARVAGELAQLVEHFEKTGWARFKTLASRLLADYRAGVAMRPQIVNGVMHEQFGICFAGEFVCVHQVARAKRNGASPGA